MKGNFAPVDRTYRLTPCSFEGTIPEELAGGQYLRNGGNTIFNEELGRDYHWFDGDGMLAGVLFRRREGGDGGIEPHFANQHILTDLYLAGINSPNIRSHIVPSIATLVNPASTIFRICLVVLRTLFIVLLSHLPGSSHGIKRISVTNTGLFYHDGRALATCESGPPIRVQLPELETVGWFNGESAEGEKEIASQPRGFGAKGPLGFMNEFTTGHPKVDPRTGELILYHCTFAAPYVHYSIAPAASEGGTTDQEQRQPISRLPVPGVSGAKMMHDFGVSSNHTVIIDLPLTLDPYQLARRKPVIDYDPNSPTRFGVFPRYDPASIRWFETDECCIFHTANTWDECTSEDHVKSVNLLVCRLTSPAPLFVAGNVEVPIFTKRANSTTESRRAPFFDRYDQDEAFVQTKNGKVEIQEAPFSTDEDAYERASALESRGHKQEVIENYVVPEEQQCRLFYYSFDTLDTSQNNITHQFALSCIPFEFPSVHPEKEMAAARYIYGCSTSNSSFNVALGKTAKIDTLVKVDALSLIAQGKQDPYLALKDCVDTRTVAEIVRDNRTNPHDLIRCFKMPPGWFAQEPRLVPRANASSEDDGYLVFYAFDESQLDEQGFCKNDAVSELWIVDAKAMADVVCRIHLPQRVPYGFHGMFFTEQQIARQRPVHAYRTVKERKPGFSTRVHDFLLRAVA